MTRRRLSFACPGELETTTGGYIYDRMLLSGLEAIGWEVERISLGDGFPFPDGIVLEEAYGKIADEDEGGILMIDGLALGAMPDIRERVGPERKVAALVHHPLYLETGLDKDASESLYASEQRALSGTDAVFCTSHETERTLVSAFGIAKADITVGLPGTEPAAAFAEMPEEALSVRLFSAASITPRKGLDLLVEALAQLKDLDWSLTIAGSADHDPSHAAHISNLIRTLGLESRITLAGVLSKSDLRREMQSSHIFVLPSWYEGYGMAFAEAIAHGLPVIGTTGGAIPDTVPQSAGILIEPGSIDGLTDALRTVITDGKIRSRIAEGARAAAANLPRWDRTAGLFSAKLETLL